MNILNVYSQASSSMCGYHALHNAKIWLEGKLQKIDHADFLSKPRSIYAINDVNKVIR
jgi:hypothetical protein